MRNGGRETVCCEGGKKSRKGMKSIDGRMAESKRQKEGLIKKGGREEEVCRPSGNITHGCS